MKQMDLQERRLLIIVKKEKFAGLISIGDIQRAIIKNLPLTTPVDQILRDDIRVASIDEEINDIKSEMITQRIECMPVLNKKGDIVDVIFWEDIIPDAIETSRQINVPVVIMAGGEGSRLKPLTNVLPKPLIPIFKKTIIEDIMDQFVKLGCHDFYISLKYKAEMIKNYLLSLNNPDYHLQFIHEDKALGTAGSLCYLCGEIRTPFFVSCCDSIVNQDLSVVYNYHKENENDLTVVAAMKYMQIPYGTIETGDDGILTKISEKPEIIYKVTSGIYILEPDIVSMIPKNEFFHITDLIFKLKEQRRRIGVFPVSENSWHDYGLLEYLPYVQK
jgi:dTDP-glucose pyrophosphorylase